MKRLSLLLCLAIAACSRSSTPPVVPSTPPPGGGTPPVFTGHYIPNWHNNDSLYALILDANSVPTGYEDTMITKTFNDTSYVVYKGTQYYIWTEPLFGEPFVNDDMQYINVIISPTTSKADAISTSAMNSATPYRYKDDIGNWNYQYQVLMVNDANTHFPKTNFGQYRSLRKYN